MKKDSTPSFIVTLPLRSTAAQQRAMEIRLDAERHIENAVLCECLRRLDLMRESKDWQAACKMPKKSTERAAAFNALRRRFDFNSPMADRFAIQCKNQSKWIGDHLGAHEVQKAATRAWSKVEQYAFGKRGRPHFKRFDTVFSVENKNNVAGIRWKLGTKTVEWNGLKLPAMMPPAGSDPWLDEALKCRTKYCRIVRREVRGKRLWSVQLIQDGMSPRRHAVADGVVGLDIGPSTIAAVSDQDAMLEKFCPTVVQPWREIKRIERAMDRSRRATNPDNFNPNGTAKKGKRTWTRSRRYQQLAEKRRERERRLAAERKIQHGNLASRILAQGTTVKTENLSYRSFQKNFGRSTKVRAAGMFIGILKRRAKEAGGEVIEISTVKTRLSQYDHPTRTYRKKPLKQRIHVLGDGSGTVQRDLYSAFLAKHVARDKLVARDVEQAFPAAKPLLERAATSFNQSAIGMNFVHPSVCKGVRADRPLKIVETAIEVPEVVAPRKRREGRKEVAAVLAARAVRQTTRLEPPAFRHGEV